MQAFTSNDERRSTTNSGLVELGQRTRLLMQVFAARVRLRGGLMEATREVLEQQLRVAQQSVQQPEGGAR